MSFLKDNWQFEWQSESESEVAQSRPTVCDPWTVAHQASPPMGFSRQEYWSGLPFPSPVYCKAPHKQSGTANTQKAPTLR